jgi:hypothetical protein
LSPGEGTSKHRTQIQITICSRVICTYVLSVYYITLLHNYVLSVFSSLCTGVTIGYCPTAGAGAGGRGAGAADDRAGKAGCVTVLL